MPPFRILRVGRPKWRTPAKSRRTVDIRDLEKSYDDEDPMEDRDDWLSETSSRSSSGSYHAEEAMLQPKSLCVRRPRRAYDVEKSRRTKFNICFAVTLGSILVFTALALVLMGQSSAKAVASSAMHVKPPVWEEFPVIDEYFGGIRKLVARNENIPAYPGRPTDILEAIRNSSSKHQINQNARRSLPEDKQTTSELGRSRAIGLQGTNTETIEKCYLDDKETIRIPSLQVYDGIPSRFPDSVLGSYEELGISNSVCIDRFGRLGPYGFGYSHKFGGTSAGMEGDNSGASRVWEASEQVDFRSVQWSQIQQRCFEKNRHRYQHASLSEAHHTDLDNGAQAQTDASIHTQRLSRTAFVIRTSSSQSYDAEDIMSLRALIAEISLATGAQYEVHFLIHLVDNVSSFWLDENIRSELLRESIPAEFQGMATLWSDHQIKLIYGQEDEDHDQNPPHLDLQHNGFLPLQSFAHEHPEYDAFWIWETNVRYTGHLLDLVTAAEVWARKQPRKGLWERNARHYVPAEHGSWEDFRQMVRVQTEHSPASKPDLWAKFGIKAQNPALRDRPAQRPVWGPQASQQDLAESEFAITPPTEYHQDHYTWGLGEDADLLTFSPIFNPESTSWDTPESLNGYSVWQPLPSRRISLGTTVRLSKRLLSRMHEETATRSRTMASEMWPSSVALHYGLKAVYVPTPVYIDRQWPIDYLAAIYNGGRNGASGGSRTSVFSDDREHNLRGITWGPDEGGFGAKLWKRWLGYRVDGKGGEEWELANEGRMCLPPMLLQPVKHVDLVYGSDVMNE